MRRAQAGEDDPLYKQFHHLQQDWNSYKQSAPRRHRHCRSSSASTTDATPVPEFLRLLHTSPKKLISSLQDSRTPSARPRPVISHDAAAATERRRSAIKSGELRGRSLLEALESAKDEAGPCGRREDICSICSSALVQESGAAAVNSSSCSCCCSLLSSSVDRYKRNRNARYIRSSSDSSSSSYIEAALANNNNNNVAKDDEVVFVSKRNEEKNIRINSSSSNNNNNANANANGEKWVVRVGWFALALVVLAFGLISYVEFGAEEITTVEYMIPT